MLPEPSLNAMPGITNPTRADRDLGPLIADCLQKFRDGDELSKQKSAHVVYSLFLSGVIILLLFIVVYFLKSSSKVVESASRVVGHLCRVSMSGGDVEGVLNSGVVEGLCKQSSMIVSSGDGIGSGSGLSVLKSLDSFCIGLKSFLRNEDQSKKTTETQKNEEKKEESESRYSVVNRSRAALSEIEWTLRSMIVEIGREEERGGEDEGRREIAKEIGGMLIRHFPSSFVGLGEKKEGEIGMDIGRLRLEMEENEKRREIERRKERESIEAERRKEREEFERLMAELQAEREANQHLIKEGLERQKEIETRKCPSKVGAKAIEFFSPSFYSLSDNTFTRLGSSNTGGCLVSFEFGAEVARLSLVVGCSCPSNFVIGIISSAITPFAHATRLYNLTGGAGSWDLYPSHRLMFLNGNPTNHRTACQKGEVGQRVVIEADRREGRRTVRMSQDGQTQPAFFTNIPVPFRFAVFMNKQNDSVTIESVEVVKDAQMVGGTIPVQM
ncbi:hypothetical protein BLNAU_10560 [Blattamonas nauphoetae]|uniref:Uncharacterized protein n=1 Tax=Blattamonas nauphoetae TaxID=2049346 RepID=A0ABQ9XSG3_9EUKA|nr:hypothetical protein BLNAU_10560 [Blattamonas nauphoetae]